jgi:hypothetical protein
MFDDLSPERRKEIRSVKSEEEYKKLTPHEMTYYRLTAPITFAPVPGATPSITEEELDNLLKNGGTLIIDKKKKGD